MKSIFPCASRKRAKKELGPKESESTSVRRCAFAPYAATENIGCNERTTPFSVRKYSLKVPTSDGLLSLSKVVPLQNAYVKVGITRAPLVPTLSLMTSTIAPQSPSRL